MNFYTAGGLVLLLSSVLLLVRQRKQAVQRSAEASSLAWVQAVENAATDEELSRLPWREPNRSAGERYLSDRVRLKQARDKQRAGEKRYKLYLLGLEWIMLRVQPAPPHELLKFCVNLASQGHGDSIARVVGVDKRQLPQFATELLGKTLAEAYRGNSEACDFYYHLLKDLTNTSFFSDCGIQRPSLPRDWHKVKSMCAQNRLSAPSSG